MKARGSNEFQQQRQHQMKEVRQRPQLQKQQQQQQQRRRQQNQQKQQRTQQQESLDQNHRQQPKNCQLQPPRFLSAARASLHTLANAASQVFSDYSAPTTPTPNPSNARDSSPSVHTAQSTSRGKLISVPSGEQLYRAGLGIQYDPRVVNRLWDTLGVLVRVHLEDWSTAVAEAEARGMELRPSDLSAAFASATKYSDTIADLIFSGGDGAQNLGGEIYPSTAPVPSPSVCQDLLQQWGYERPLFLGWSRWSLSRKDVHCGEENRRDDGGGGDAQERSEFASEARELLLAVGWMVATSDAFSVARHLAWAQRSGAELLPPWKCDGTQIFDSSVSGSIRGLHRSRQFHFDGDKGRDGSDSAINMHSLGTKGDAACDVAAEEAEDDVNGLCQALLMRYGHLKHSLQTLRRLEVQRAKQLEEIDRLQALPKGSGDNDPKNRNKRNLRNRGNNERLSAYEVLLCSSTERQKTLEEALERSSALAERLVASKQLEAPFWEWLADVALMPQNSSLRVAEEEEGQEEVVAGRDKNAGVGDASDGHSNDIATPMATVAAAGVAARKLVATVCSKRQSIKEVTANWETFLQQQQQQQQQQRQQRNGIESVVDLVKLFSVGSPSLVADGSSSDLSSCLSVLDSSVHPVDGCDRDGIESFWPAVGIKDIVLSTAFCQKMKPGDCSDASDHTDAASIYAILTQVREKVDGELAPLQGQLHKIRQELAAVETDDSRSKEFDPIPPGEAYLSPPRPPENSDQNQIRETRGVVGSLEDRRQKARREIEKQQYRDLQMIREILEAIPERREAHAKVLTGALALTEKYFPQGLETKKFATAHRRKLHRMANERQTRLERSHTLEVEGQLGCGDVDIRQEKEDSDSAQLGDPIAIAADDSGSTSAIPGE